MTATSKHSSIHLAQATRVRSVTDTASSQSQSQQQILIPLLRFLDHVGGGCVTFDSVILLLMWSRDVDKKQSCIIMGWNDRIASCLASRAPALCPPFRLWCLSLPSLWCRAGCAECSVPAKLDVFLPLKGSSTGLNNNLTHSPHSSYTLATFTLLSTLHSSSSSSKTSRSPPVFFAFLLFFLIPRHSFN